MDLQQTVQDLAEAWVAASTDTSFSRTQLQVYGTQGEDDNTSEGGGGGEPSTSADTGHTSAPPSPPAQPTGDGGLLASSSSHSRKRKQSSPQPRREEAEAAAAAPPAPSARSTSKGNPPPLKRPKETEGKMLPVHCVVERLDTPPSQDSDGKNGEAVEEKRKKGYAIVPSSLQLRNLVRVALSKLDYPPDKAKNATGVIQVRNWKALPFSSITDNQQSSVGQLFGDLLSHITLKITILSSDTPNLPDPRCGPSATASSAQSQSSRAGINASGSVLSLNNLSAGSVLRHGLQLPFGIMARRTKAGAAGGGGEAKGLGGSGGSKTAHVVSELRIKLLQVLEKRGPTLLVSHGCPFSQVSVAQILQGKYNKPLSVEKIQAFYQWYNIYYGLTDNTLLPPEKVDSTTHSRLSSRHWRRPRTLFNQRIELPRLLRWYRQNPRPSRNDMEDYLTELNSTDFRRAGTPLQYSSIAVWFKNARVKYRHLLRSSALARMREDMASYSSGKSPTDNLMMVDEGKDSEEEKEGEGMMDEEEDLEEDLDLEEEEEEVEKEVVVKKKVEAPPPKTPVRSFARSPARSPAKSPVARPLQLKQEPTQEEEEQVGNENRAAAMGASIAKPVILPSLLHMQARPHLQPVSIVSNGLIVPSRQHNGSHQHEASLQVPDLRKIASGFGISLTPEMAAAAHGLAMPRLAHPHFLHTMESLQKESPSMRLEYHNGALSVPKPTHSPHAAPSSAAQRRTPTPQSQKPPTESPKPKSPQSAGSQTASTSTRIPRKRFTIDPTFEVPKLQAWFSVDKRPDRQTIERYVQELNSSEWRRHQPKYNNRVVYVWFKNARAKYSKMQVSPGDPEMEQRRHDFYRMHHHEAHPAEGSPPYYAKGQTFQRSHDETPLS